MLEKNFNIFKFTLLDLYTLCTFLYVLVQSNISIQYTMIKNLIMIMLFCFMIFGVIYHCATHNKINIRLMFFLLTILIWIFLMIFMNKWDKNLLLIPIFAYIVSDYKVDDILKRYSYATFAGIFFVILLMSVHLLNNDQIIDVSSNELRQSVGFNWVSFGPNMYLSAVAGFLAYKKEKIKIFQLIVFLFINIWFYKKTLTSAAWILIDLALIMSFIFRNNFTKEHFFRNKIVKFAFKNITSVTAITTIGFQLIYNKLWTTQFMINLNKLSNFRLSLNRNAFINYKILPLGQHIIWDQMSSNNNYFYIDSSYIRILFTGGIVTLIGVCIVLDILSKNAVSSKNYYYTAMLGIIVLHGISDPLLISCRDNPFLITIVPSFIEYYSKNKKVSEKEYGH